MKHRSLILLALFAVGVGPASAQSCGGGPGCGPPPIGIAPVQSETAGQPQEPDEIVPVVPATERMTTKIAFVVDSSGSMDNSRRMSMAITFAKGILGQGMDELLVALFSFRLNFERWPGVKHDGIGKPPPKGWAHFPGVPQLKSAQDWLTARGASGGTSPDGALGAALAESVKKLTIVLITDGEFDADTFKSAIHIGQMVREARGLGRAVIIIIGIGADSAEQQHLKDVGKSELGGLYVVRPPEPKKVQTLTDK